MQIGMTNISTKLLVGFACAICLTVAIPSWGDPPSNRRPHPSAPATVLISDDPGVSMRGKLARSKDILEGLVNRDFDSISRAATELKRISAATDWPYAKETKFQELNAEFQQLCDQLDALAIKLNYEGVQFTFQHLTMSCIGCHDHVRDAMRGAEINHEGDTRLQRP